MYSDNKMVPQLWNDSKVQERKDGLPPEIDAAILYLD
jgi:hypothetical protein